MRSGANALIFLVQTYNLVLLTEDDQSYWRLTVNGLTKQIGDSITKW
uniref:Uncharacterized protein n=1 Tax=Arundo donax TaxID=35708 RepID=A0A0A9GRK2_ARUDO